MGLDMYLQKVKRIGKTTPKELVATDSYFSYLERPEDCKDCTLEEWCGISANEVNMLVVMNYKDEYIHRYASWDENKQYGWKTIFETMASWRKANHIHKWFVDNVQDGNDNCGTYEVTKEQLEELLNICKRVVDESNFIELNEHEGYIEDPSIAEELLPRTSGFFFGDIEYDKWYLEDIEHTIKVIEDVLKTINFEKEIIMYSSSW